MMSIPVGLSIWISLTESFFCYNFLEKESTLLLLLGSNPKQQVLLQTVVGSIDCGVITAQELSEYSFMVVGHRVLQSFGPIGGGPVRADFAHHPAACAPQHNIHHRISISVHPCQKKRQSTCSPARSNTTTPYHHTIRHLLQKILSSSSSVTTAASPSTKKARQLTEERPHNTHTRWLEERSLPSPIQ